MIFIDDINFLKAHVTFRSISYSDTKAVLKKHGIKNNNVPGLDEKMIKN